MVLLQVCEMDQVILLLVKAIISEALGMMRQEMLFIVLGACNVLSLMLGALVEG